MSAAQLETLTRTVIEAWNRSDWSTYRALTGAAFVHEELGNGQVSDDVDDVVLRWQRLKAAFPGAGAQIVSIETRGTWTVTGVVWRSVHASPSPDEPVPTYKQIQIWDLISMNWRGGELETERHQLGFLSLMAPLHDHVAPL